ncbi:mads box protein, putative [Ricinus communis]|uniref:Mads box protein, putative n=1 Tax=Ricinus communis TaxID=3988 RepID=B9S146_RICCO|nr:mads box protein, putative [Ricinus communis]|eukprot:XP_002519715.1 agamous-like MADS-box protein AGL61 [Ricinus communis]
MAGKKQTKGRQKITMKRIENEEDRLITFSKRRSGIYKKASELITLCGAEVGILVFSPAGKPFSFGHPSLESIANRFLGKNVPPSDNTHPLVEAHRKMRINELNKQYNELLNRLESEKERGSMLKKTIRGKGCNNWWEAPIDDLNMQELEQIYAMFEELHSTLCKKMNEKRNNGVSIWSSSIPQMNNHGLMVNNSSAYNIPNNENHFSSFHHGCGFGQGQF